MWGELILGHAPSGTPLPQGGEGRGSSVFSFATQRSATSRSPRPQGREGIRAVSSCRTNASVGSMPSPPWGRGWPAPALSSAGAGRVRGSAHSAVRAAVAPSTANAACCYSPRYLGRNRQPTASQRILVGENPLNSPALREPIPPKGAREAHFPIL
jgi:hypothetical protein